MAGIEINARKQNDNACFAAHSRIRSISGNVAQFEWTLICLDIGLISCCSCKVGLGLTTNADSRCCGPPVKKIILYWNDRTNDLFRVRQKMGNSYESIMVYT